MENRFIWLIILCLPFLCFRLFLYVLLHPIEIFLCIYVCCYFQAVISVCHFVKSETLFDSFFFCFLLSIPQTLLTIHRHIHTQNSSSTNSLSVFSVSFFGKGHISLFLCRRISNELDWKFKLSFVGWMLWITGHIRLLKSGGYIRFY